MRRTLALTCALLPLVVSLPASADQVPFTDPHRNGFIALCDKAGHPVTGGDLGAMPFVWTAISSTPTPAAYDLAGRKAILVAFQPREKVYPGEWSGSQLTASTAYTSAAHPVAQSTDVDVSLLSFTQAFPPRWNGLVELRMYFSAPGVPPHQKPYPATVLQVTGDRWKVVDGGTLDCRVGAGRSVESQYLPPSRLTPLPSAAGSAAANGAGPTASTAAASGTTSADTAARVRKEDKGFLGSPLGYGVLALLLLLGGGVAVTVRRATRRGSPGP